LSSRSGSALFCGAQCNDWDERTLNRLPQLQIIQSWQFSINSVAPLALATPARKPGRDELLPFGMAWYRDVSLIGIKLVVVSANMAAEFRGTNVFLG
jgi:hypothetical protein